MICAYGMKLRPPGPGAQPKEGLLKAMEFGGRYHGLLTYDRQLAAEEEYQYDLEFILGVDPQDSSFALGESGNWERWPR